MRGVSNSQLGGEAVTNSENSIVFKSNVQWELAGATGNNGFEREGSRNGAWLRCLQQIRLCGTFITRNIINHKYYINKRGFASSLAALDLMFLKERGHKMSLEQEDLRHLLFSLIVIRSHAQHDNTCSKLSSPISRTTNLS